MFLTPIKDFVFEEHIHVDKDTTTSLELERVVESLLRKPFKRGQPLWEVVIFPNLQVRQVQSNLISQGVPLSYQLKDRLYLAGRQRFPLLLSFPSLFNGRICPLSCNPIPL